MKTQSASSRQEKQQNKNNEPFSLDSQTDWQRLEAISDEEIDLSEIPELTEKELLSAKPLQKFLGERGIDYDPALPTTLLVYHEDGTSSTHRLAPKGNIIVLDSDVQRYFHDSNSVNRTLRALIHLIPQT